MNSNVKRATRLSSQEIQQENACKKADLSLVHTCEIGGTGISTRMLTLATYACLVRVTSETFSSAIFIDREEIWIWNISHSDWLNSCCYACAYFTSVHASLFSCLRLRLRLCLSHKCEPGFSQFAALLMCLLLLKVIS